MTFFPAAAMPSKRAVEQRVEQHERHAAEQHGARRRDGLAHEDLDVPEAPLEDRVGEGERDQHERHDGEARQQRRLESERARQRREDQERREADDHAEGDPADLLLGLRVLAVAAQQVDQPGQHGRDVDGEVDEPQPLAGLEEGRRAGGGPRREDRQLRADVDRGRDVEQREDAPRADRAREQQEEVQQQRGQERAEEILREPRDPPHRVVRSGRRQDVDAERAEAERPEHEGGAGALARDREEPDDQVQDPDEGEEEVRRVEAHRGLAERHAADLARGGQDDERVREGLARQLLFRAGERARGLAVGEDDPVARGKARARRRALGIDRPQDEGAAVAVRREAGGREACRPCGQTRRTRARPFRGSAPRAPRSPVSLPRGSPALIQQSECHSRAFGSVI